MILPIVPALLASAAPVAVPQTVEVMQQADAAVMAAQPQTAAAGPDLPVEVPADAATTGEQAAPADPAGDPASEQAPGDVIIVEGSVGPPPGDPAIQVNEAVFNIAQDVDQAIVGPVAEVYEEDIPKPLRNGLRNFLRNLLEPVNALNFLLQLKPGKALETLGRFAINSTIGVVGLVDMASREPFNLPWRRNGLANTLGYYGVGPGPYLVLPLIGATTLRDILGSTIDQAIVPLAVGAPLNTPYYAIPAYTINSLQFRMEFDETLTEIRGSIDPYEATREYYLCSRENDINALRNRPLRDCRIDVLMGEIEPGEGLGEPAVETPAPAPVAIVPAVEAPPAEPPAPVTPEMVSIPVIQPLPAN